MSSPAEPVVYFDETGNSGQNLLDPGQPIFTLAGVHLPDDVAAAIVAEVRSQLPATQGEPKYGSLAKATRGREALVRAFEQLPADNVQAMVVLKPFLVVTKMVDLLVEPLAHRTGFNLYEDKQGLALADLLQVCGPVFGTPEAYNRMLQAFVDWIRQRVSTDDLYEAIAAFKATVTHAGFAEWIDLLEICRPIADETAEDIASGEMEDVLDPAVPVLYRVCPAFADSIGRFRLVHDSSKVVDRWTATLRTVHFFPNPAEPGEYMEEMPVSRIDFADSKAHPQLQLADWTAGAVRQWATAVMAGSAEPFGTRLEPLVKPWVIDTIWPDSTPPSERVRPS